MADEEEPDDLKRLTGNAWDRLDDEPKKAWEAFKVYRDMGLTRTIPKAAQQLGRPRTTLSNYSTAHSWLMRAAAYDKEQDRLEQLWILEERKRAVQRHVRQAQALSSKWLQRLATLDPSTLSPSEVLQYAKIATQMERDALRLSEPDTVVNINVLQAVDALSVEDTRLRLEVLQKEIAARSEALAARAEGSPDSAEEIVDAELVEG